MGHQPGKRALRKGMLLLQPRRACDRRHSGNQRNHLVKMMLWTGWDLLPSQREQMNTSILVKFPVAFPGY